MPIKAGDLRDIVTIERAEEARDAVNQPVLTWTEIGSPWAQVFYGRGDERREAARTSASVTATFRLRLDPITATVTPRDRLRFAGAIWEIASAVPFERDGLDITATRSAD